MDAERDSKNHPALSARADYLPLVTNLQIGNALVFKSLIRTP